ncbi:MAG: TIM barrel protein [Planctomycetaceae bacterium]|nr:TIM barrel protein [Planctomycetaceae bacterium]
MPDSIPRRTFLASLAAGSVSLKSLAAAAVPASELRDGPAFRKQLRNEVGMTVSSFSGHMTARPTAGKFTLLELPRLMRDELGMRVIDLNTDVVIDNDPAWAERARQAVADAGCVLTNLKLNQRGLDVGHEDPEVRRRAVAGYSTSIETAARLGCAWVRVLPLRTAPHRPGYVAALRELADVAAGRGLRLLVENYGWMEDDPASVATLIREVDRGLAASPDTGNWADHKTRLSGLRQTFPLAVTCDFKFRQLNEAGEHPLFDLESCFQVGWQAGYRGPWCLEHANRDRKVLFQELRLIRDRLRGWIATAEQSSE